MLIGISKHLLKIIILTTFIGKKIIINNLFCIFRSLLARDPKGRLTAGIYFPLKPKTQEFTMFFEGSNGKQRKKLKFEHFLELQKVKIKI